MCPAVLPLSALPIRGYDLVAMTSFEKSATWLLPDAPGLWCQQRRAEISGQDPSPALFLDRDGVIVEEVKYLHRVEDVRLIAGVDKIIATCNENNIPVVLVTNQSGVGRGLYGWAEFAAVQDSITDALDRLGAHRYGIGMCVSRPSPITVQATESFLAKTQPGNVSGG